MAIKINERFGGDVDQSGVDTSASLANQSALNTAYDANMFMQKSSETQSQNLRSGYAINLGNSRKGLAEKVQM